MEHTADWIQEAVGRLRSSANELAQASAPTAAENRFLAQSRAAEALRGIGVPRRIRETLQQLAETRAIAEVRRWLADPSGSWCLVLAADKGLGKSTAAGWWLSRISADVHGFPRTIRRWWPAADLSTLDYYGDEFRSICGTRELVLDDLGVEYADVKGAFQSKLDRLLDARYREIRQTVITTNLSAESFAARYSARVYDRIREGGQWVTITGESMRGAQR